VELPLLSPAASDIALPADEEEPEMDSIEKEEALDDTNRYRYLSLGVACLLIRIRIRIHRIHMFLGLGSISQRYGSGSGSISQRHGSADPDLDPPPQCHGSATLPP
jgi:hypothetical protein